MNRPILEVNLKAIIHNLEYFRSNIRPETKMLFMIKANAYGAGSIAVARVMEAHDVDYLGVARTEEGISLREAGIVMPILVMLPDDERYGDLAKYHLEAEIYSIEQLAQIAQTRHSIKIHLKMDTGMHRSGMEPVDIPRIKNILAENPQLKVMSIASHLTAAEMPEHDSFTRIQATRLQKMYDQLGLPVLKHLVNSNGILRFPQYHFDMVRFGIGVYGTGVEMAPLIASNTLKASVLQVRMVAPPETIGYCRKGIIARPSLIATLNIGYADGISRLLGNGRYSFLIRGKHAPTIGNISMDTTMIDVTEIPYVQAGDEVIIFGKDHPVEFLAETIGSIPYEVFTSISARVERTYRASL